MVRASVDLIRNEAWGRERERERLLLLGGSWDIGNFWVERGRRRELVLGLKLDTSIPRGSGLRKAGMELLFFLFFFFFVTSLACFHQGWIT